MYISVLIIYVYLDKMLNMQYIFFIIFFNNKKIKMCKRKIFISQKLYSYFQYVCKTSI